MRDILGMQKEKLLRRPDKCVNSLLEILLLIHSNLRITVVKSFGPISITPPKFLRPFFQLLCSPFSNAFCVCHCSPFTKGSENLVAAKLPLPNGTTPASAVQGENLHGRNGRVLDVQTGSRSRIAKVAMCYVLLHGAIISVALIRFSFPYARTIASHFCVQSLSLSRSPKGSASLAFQRSSQSD